MASVKTFTALGLALILCGFLGACGGGSSKPPTPNAPVIVQTSLPNGAVNVPYGVGLQVARGTGTGPFTWSIVSGSLPAGLSLDGTKGQISGTPTTIENASFTVQVTDAKSLTGSRSLSINIRGAVVVTPPTLPGGTVGTAYSANLSATGGVLPYTWSVSSGTLPAGLTLTTNADSTATISGTPTTLGTSTFTIQVSDSESAPATGSSGPLSISIEGLVSIVNTSLPDGNIAIFYDTQLTATGGQTPYTWSLTAGTLPPGLNLTANTGVISGTPTTIGTYPITVQVADSERTPATGTAMFSITINPTPELQVTTSSLPGAVQGIRYSTSVAATGGVPPYSWIVTTGPLPAGLTLSGTGILSGTPTGGTGIFPITVQVTDTLGSTASSAAMPLNVNAGPLVITTVALPAGIQSVPYSAALGAAGGTPPYTWALRIGSLPSGLSLSPSTGVISGTPTGTTGNSLQFQVQDSATPPATVISQPVALNINPALSNAVLTGDYAFSFSGYNHGTPVFAAGRFTADGTGVISNGLLDANQAGGPPVSDSAFTGTYSISANGVGTMTFNTAGPSLVLAVAVDNSGAGRFIQSDPANPQEYASGAIKKQTIVTPLPFGNYAFGSVGVDLAESRFASAGTFQLNNIGHLGNGITDINDGGTVIPGAILTGSYTAPDASTGRGTASLSVNGGHPQNFGYYEVSSSEIIQVSIDQVSDSSPATLTSVLKGTAGGVSFSNMALKGASVVLADGVNPNGGSPQAIGLGGLFNGDGTTDGNGFGNASLLFDQNTAGTVAQQQIAGGQYKVAPLNGRVILKGFGGTPPVLYLVNANQAFLIGTDANGTFGALSPQTAATTGIAFTNASVLGGYVGGSGTPVLPAVTNQIDWLFSDGNVNINVSQDSSGPGGPQTNQFALTYQVDATGRALLESNPGGTLQGIMFVMSSTRFGIVSADPNPVLSTFSLGKAVN
jgi:Putative Ig domain